MDTFLNFFRAYYDSRGYLIYNLSTIRRNYITSGWFFINLLSSVPTSLLIWTTASSDHIKSKVDSILMILDVFKLLRIFRLKRLLSTSSVVDSYWEKMNVLFSSKFLSIYFHSRHRLFHCVLTLYCFLQCIFNLKLLWNSCPWSCYYQWVQFVHVNRQFTFHNRHLNLHLCHHCSYAALDRLYLGMRSVRRSRFIFWW